MSIWYFTFGSGHAHEGRCQPIRANSYGEARQRMFDVYGEKWAFQYSQEEWEKAKIESIGKFEIEREFPII